MFTLAQILFAIILALLLLHEMDAIRNAEWKMLIILKDMNDTKAFKMFTLLHLPLYIITLMLILSEKYQIIAYYAIDMFLIVHSILHLIFERHSKNGLKNVFSRSIIYTMGLLSIFHILITYFWCWVSCIIIIGNIVYNIFITIFCNF